MTWSNAGITYEPEQRHAELIVQGVGLQHKDKAVNTPGIKPASGKEEMDDDEPLSGTEATQYRALVPRGLYLSQDRTDIQYAVNQLSRAMAMPTCGDWRRLKRLAR